MMPDQRGTVTAFVVVFTFALVVTAGLVVDGGLVLAARRQAFNEAEAAARAGAQAVISDSIRTGQALTLDPPAARAHALAYVAGTGHQATVEVLGDTVAVEVWFSRPMTILGAGGLASVTVRGRGSAHGVRGIAEVGE